MKNVNKLLYRLVAVLLVSVLVSTCLLCGLLARYTTSGSGFDSARVIAFRNLQVKEYGDFKEGTAVLLPGHDLAKEVVVEFGGSEASTIVFVELTLTESLTGNNEEWVRNGNQFDLKMINSHKVDETDDDYINVLSFSVNGVDATDKPQLDTEKWYFLEKTDDGKFVYYKVLSPNKPLVRKVNKPSEEVSGSFIAQNGKLSVSEYVPTITLEKDSEGNYIKTKYDELIETKINIKATAVQANGFENVGKAWDSIKNK